MLRTNLVPHLSAQDVDRCGASGVESCGQSIPSIVVELAFLDLGQPPYANRRVFGLD